MVFLKEYAKNIVIISILATIFEIMIPEGKHKKVACISVGLVVMLTVMAPLEAIANLKNKDIFPKFSIEESFPSYEKNIIADVFEENLSCAIKEKVANALNKNILCKVTTSRDQDGVITAIERIEISPYDEKTAHFIANEFSFAFSDIKGDKND